MPDKKVEDLYEQMDRGTLGQDEKTLLRAIQEREAQGGANPNSLLRAPGGPIDRERVAAQSQRALDQEGPSLAWRIAKGGLNAGLTGAALATAPETGGGSLLFKEAATKGIPQVAKWLAARTMGGLTSVPVRAAAMGTAGEAGFSEPVGDYGNEVRSGLATLASMVPGAKFLKPTGSMGREAVRALYPFAENYGIHYAGQPFEGNHEFNSDLPGIGPALASTIGSVSNVLSGQAYKVAQQLPRTVNPEAIRKLEAMVQGGQITQQEAETLTKTIRDQAETQLQTPNVAGLLQGPEKLDFKDFARDRFAAIAKMPSRTKEDIAARTEASNQLLRDWQARTNPGTASQTKALQGLQLGSVDQELEDMLNPTMAWSKARSEGTPMYTRVDDKGMLHFAEPPFNSGLPGEKKMVGRMNTPTTMPIEKMTGPKLREENAAERVGQAYSWVNSAKNNVEYRDLLKRKIRNFAEVNPGTLDKDKIEALSMLQNAGDSRKFSEKLTDPNNLRIFNEHFAADPEMRALGKRQIISEFTKEINGRKLPKPGSNAEISTTILDKVAAMPKDEVEKLFGEGTHKGLMDIAESVHDAEKYIASKGLQINAKNLTWPLLWAGFMAGKEMGVDSSLIAPAAYGVTGLALGATTALSMKPQLVERLLDHNGAPARMLKEGWKNPEKNGRYIRLVGAYISSNWDKTDPKTPK